MLINLVEKYGLIPKEVWPEAFTAGRSMRLRKIMNYKVWKGFVEFILSLLLFLNDTSTRQLFFITCILLVCLYQHVVCKMFCFVVFLFCQGIEYNRRV